MKKLFATLLVLISAILVMGMGARLAHSEEVVHVYAGFNGVYFDGVHPLPDDFELGANASASLSPHISAVGAGYWGFSHTYLRGSAGARFTASNPDDPNFSVGLGAQYHFSSEPDIRPEGVAPDASIGWIPWSVSMPNVILIAQGQYFLKANQASAIIGVHYRFGGEHHVGQPVEVR